MLAAAAPLVAFVTLAHAAPTTGVVDVTTRLAYGGGNAAGTGIVLTRSGEVLTNNHVIRGAASVHVLDPSTGRRYSATVVGYSVQSDIAVLRLRRASRLRTVALGSSAGVRIGERVVAVGNANGAGGMPKTATGKVTGLHRSIVATDDLGIPERLSHLIRIDAALRPGDSGGPLLDAHGRVIGIDTAASPTFSYASSHEAFAIPIARALAVARQIERRRASPAVHVGSTPFLGVSLGSGLVVRRVVGGAPAARAGISAGDTIEALDGRRVSSYAALSARLLLHRAGDTVTVVWLDGAGLRRHARLRTAAGPPQ